jgi:hypothetical protein
VFGAFLGIGCLWLAKFETTLAFAAVTIGVLAVLGFVRYRALTLAIVVLVLAGTRTDLIVALAGAELARWWWTDRRPATLRSAVVLGAAGALATAVLAQRFAHNPYNNEMVELAYNLRPTVLATGAGFLLPPLLPWVLCWRGPGLRDALRPHLPIAIPLLGLCIVEIGQCTAVGRLEEVRMFFPLAAPLAVLGILGWRAAASLGIEPIVDHPAGR